MTLPRHSAKPNALGAGWSSPVARQAHNLKAAGSNPAPATNQNLWHLPVRFGLGFCIIIVRFKAFYVDENVCNNSGGSLVRRGPVYSELSLYAEMTEAGELRLVNHLGIDLGDAPEEMLGRLDSGHIDRSLIVEGKRPCFR